MNKKYSITCRFVIFLTLVICFSNTVWGGEVLFNKKYLRETGKVEVFKDTFSVSAGYSNFKLIVKNGKDGKNRVSSALININGFQIVSPFHFNRNVDLINKSISLKRGINKIIVEIRSNPGSFIVVTIVGDRLNKPPVANAGPDQTVTSRYVQLNGSGSSDVDGNPLTFEWSFVSQPSGSIATLSDTTLVNPTFTADKFGDYVVQLIVNDGTVDSAPDTVVISTLNSAPVANAGPDQTVSLTFEVNLNGSGSTDVDGDQLSYSWSFVSKPAGSAASLSDPAIVSPAFLADKFGAYTVQLIVNDGTVDSAPDTVVISTLNSAPVANAGPDQSSLATQVVQLDGSKSSDIDGNPLSFFWSFVTKPSGSNAALSDPSAVKPTFVIDVSDTYVAQLIVNDGLVNSAPDTVTISTMNSPPIANAGPDQTVYVGDNIELNGSSSSDVDGNPLKLSWSFVSLPSGSLATLSDTNIVNPTFTADKFGDYVVQLIVHDGSVNSSPDTVKISTLNSKPVAKAGPDQTIHVGKPVFLDGSASSDVDGDLLTYAWSFTSSPSDSAAVLSNGNTVKPNFLPDKVGDYVIQLIVNDGTVNSIPDSVTISTSNSKPVAKAGPAQSITAESQVQLDGSGSSDADGDMLEYFWAITVLPVGSTSVLSDQAIFNPTFVADLAGTYVAQLIVNDGFSSSDPDTTTITALTKMVNVPDVVGMTQTAAQSSITAASLSVGTISKATSATVPKESVISQNPAAGSSVEVGSSVSLVISSGPAMISVPNIVGMTQSAAESAITAGNLTVGTITQANSDTVPAGSVISQSPVGGTSVPQAYGCEPDDLPRPPGSSFTAGPRHRGATAGQERSHLGLCRYGIPLHRRQPHSDRGGSRND